MGKQAEDLNAPQQRDTVLLLILVFKGHKSETNL